MSRLAIVHERTPTGGWRPVGVLLGTPARLDMRFLPGLPDWQAWGANIAENSVPPFRDGLGFDPARGTWEDWIPWAVRSFTNGHDTWLTMIEEPEPTIGENYERYVLGATPTPLTAPPVREPTDEIPELGGYKKVRPA